MFGYSNKKELLDIPDIKKQLYFSPDERGSHILDTGRDEVDVYRMRRQDGSEIWVEDHGGYIHDERGNIIYHEGILRDITERKHMEEALRESEEKYRMIFNNSPLGIFRSTFEGRLLEINTALAKMLGYDSSEQIIRETHDIAGQLYVCAEDRYRIVAEQMHSHDFTQHLNRYRRRDGSECVANLYLKTVRDHEGRPICLEGIVEDVTERRRIEEARSRLAAIVESSDDAIIGQSLDGVITSWNRGAEKLYGYDAEEMKGKPTSILVPLNRPDDVKQILERLAGGESVQPYETKRMRKDGSLLDVSVTISPIKNSQDRIIGASSIARDISARKRAEEALIESEARFKKYFDLGLVGMAIETPAGNLIAVNDRLCEMFGYDRAELMKKQWAELTYPDDIGKDDDLFESLIRGEIDQYSMDKRFLRKDGQVVDWVISATCTLGKDGRADQVFGFASDITERKRLEEELRKSTQFLATIVEDANVWLDVIDEKRNVVIWNRAAESISGYSREEVTGHGKVWEWLYPDAEYRKQITDPSFTTLQQQERPGQDVETRIKRKDGETRIISWNERDLLDKNGKNTGSIVIGRDVTEERRMQGELRRYSENLEGLVKERTGRLVESEKRYRVLFESSPVALWEEDFSDVAKFLDGLRDKGVKDLRAYLKQHPEDLAMCAGMVKVLDVNEATLRLYGAKSVTELRGELLKVFTSDFQDRFREELVALIERRTQFASDFDNQTLTGEIRHISLIVNIVPGYEDTLAKVLVAIIDLTDRKEMEHRLQQAERLAAVGETAAMVGHDLRNPLQGIAGAIHLLKDGSLTAAERDEMLRLMQKSVDYSNAIVSNLFEYSREIRLNLAETTPKAVITEAIAAVSVPRLVKVNDLSEDHPTLRIDLGEMRRVVVNIIQNAIDAMPQGGTLTISSKRSESNVEIEFSDTGSGIPEKIMQNLWKPLQTTKAKGMGLGLAICKRIVEAHKGSMSVKSKTGEGTTVTIRLPAEVVEVKTK
jgi:PAS domain S-box-containing protein